MTDVDRPTDDLLRLEDRHTGEILRIGRVRDAGGQIVLTIDGSLPAGADGPPLRVHFEVQEEGVVAAGTLGGQAGKETVQIPAGGTTVFPAGVPHRWWKAGRDLLEFRGRVKPTGDLDRYLQAIFAVVNASPSGRPSIFYLAHIAWRHRRTQRLEVPSSSIQRLLFPFVLLAGRLLGKYRSSSWPGSPSSCPGAPLVEPP